MAAAPGGIPLSDIPIDITVKPNTGTPFEISIPASSTGKELLAALPISISNIKWLIGIHKGKRIAICGNMPLTDLDDFNVVLVVKLGGSAQDAPSIHPGKGDTPCPYCD